MLQISDRSFDLIVREEDGDQFYYTRHYEHFDYPGGASGPTIGIGYDCGYVTRDEVMSDWTAIVNQPTIDVIMSAVGRRGAAAEAWVQDHALDITVPWDVALAEFRLREVPKWVAHVSAALPNCDQLSSDSFGALVSLAYNRGASFALPGPRFAEMRAIHEHMSNEDFGAIPDDILSMRRLWRRGGDLWQRREHEAALFRDGLGQKPVADPSVIG